VEGVHAFQSNLKAITPFPSGSSLLPQEYDIISFLYLSNTEKTPLPRIFNFFSHPHLIDLRFKKYLLEQGSTGCGLYALVIKPVVVLDVNS
jgi:hypothetical protein